MSLKDFTDLVPLELKFRVGRSLSLTVDARNVWESLEVRDHFRSWIKRRIKKYGFKKGQDFCTWCADLRSKKHGGHNRIEYHVTLDMAKELGMIEATDLGHQIRLYFIDAEKELQAVRIARGKTIPVHKELAEAIQEYKSWIRTINPDSAYVTRSGAPFDTFGKMINKGLFNLPKVPDNFRDCLNRDNLNRLETVERACIGFIRQEMTVHGDDYKAVFFVVKKRLSVVIIAVGPVDLSAHALPDPLFR